MPNNQHGGKRPNAGRKQKYGEETVTISLRVPISEKQNVRGLVKEYLNKKATP